MEKYLRHYAEAEIAALDSLPGHFAWKNVVVIPACNETPEFLGSPPQCDTRSLMILVINESEAAPKEVSQSNVALAQTVQKRFTPIWQSSSGKGLSLWQDANAERDVLLVDRFSEGQKLPPKSGVGLARKIGVDLAVRLIQQQRIDSSWVHCSDADVQLPETYFTCSNSLAGNRSKYAALVYPFNHYDDRGRGEDSGVFLATRLYELSLRYYVAGMKYAGSPYAFHTIGSTMAVNALHYAKVRGFPKREAGEDFYLLNKLAKVGEVLELEDSPECHAIQIASRRSDRVPFGTGAAVNKITTFPNPVETFRFYDPEVFDKLKTWLQSLPMIWQSGSAELTNNIFSQQPIDQDSPDRHRNLLAVLKGIKTEQALEHAFRQSKNLDQFMRQMNTWFDAFRTLKVIHALRDLCMPSINFAKLESQPLFQYFLSKDSELLTFHESLNKIIATQANPTNQQAGMSAD